MGPRFGRSALRWTAKVAALAAVYFLVARVGLRYATIGESISPVWPPTGFALAALLLLGTELWPGILCGAFLANAVTAVPLTAALGIAGGNTAEAILGAYLMRRRAGGGRIAFEQLSQVRALVVVAGPLSALASAAVGVTMLFLAGALPAGSRFGSALGLWWAGDYVGALVVAPALLTWATSSGAVFGRRSAAELILLAGGCIVVAELVLGRLFPASFLPPVNHPYLLFPLVIAAALRAGPRGASLTTLLVALIAVGHAARGGGPFVMQTVPSTAAALLLYIGVLAATALTLGAVAAQNRRAEALEVQSRQAQKMEAIGRLAGGIAHDFNNILTAILGTSQLLLEHLVPGSRGHDDVEEIQRAGQRAAGLTRQLLLFSRQQVLEPRVLDLNAVVVQAQAMLRRLIREDVELRTALAPDLGTIWADAGQVEQVILNLTVNARDAMPAGGVVTIETANVELNGAYAERHVPARPGPYVLLAVSDTGVGMDAATLARVFEPFFTTKGPGEGTGLGLATVYGIVKQSSGYIWAYSEPGRGATFKVYFPRAGAAPEPGVESGVPVGAPGGSEVVLVVEDQDDVRRLTVRILEGRGYRVLSAASGEEALRLVRHNGSAIDLLLIDVVMPGTSGPEVVRLLEPARPAMKVLYMSGYPDASIVHQGLLKPGLAFLQKPFSPEALAQKVRDVLDKRG